MTGPMQRFLPFLPPTGGTVDDTLAVEAAGATQEDLEWLLACDGAEFWGVVRADPSLPALVDSYLRYARRPFDERASEASTLELAIGALLLEVLHRCVCRAEPGAPPPSQRAALLTRLLDLPKLLDLCALFSATAPGKLQELVQEALRLLPGLSGELAAAAGTVASNLAQVVDACVAAASRAGSDPAMMHNVLDGAAYLRDVCLTLCALVVACPPAGPALLSRGPTLLESLAAVHDSLLPALARLAAAPDGGGSSGGGERDAQRQRLYLLGSHIELGSERAVQLLLTRTYLEGAAGHRAKQQQQRGGAAAPAAAARAGPSERGEGLLSAVMVLGHREDDLSGPAGGRAAGAATLGGMPLAAALAARHGFAGAVEEALLRGAVALDEAQSAYLAALLGVSSLAEAPAPVAGGAAAPAAGANGRADAGSGGSIATAVLMSQIAQIKDLLPDYGDGYLALCLDMYDGQPEAVINALLLGDEGGAGGGGLHPQLAALDRRMGLQQYLERFAGAGGSGSGVATRVGPSGEGKASGKRLAVGPEAGGSARGGSAAAARPAVPAAAKPRPESLTSKYLDLREGCYRDNLISTAIATQFEYEDGYDDEYDDSFDELLHYGADGVAEAEEGERGPSSQRGAPPHQQQQPAGPAGPARAAERAMQGLSLGGAPAPPGAGHRRGRKPAGRLWVLDGRIYNYPKPGALEVVSKEDAERQLAAARQAALEIHGLGPGGNKPLPPGAAQQWRQQQAAPAAEEAAAAAAQGGGRPGPAPREPAPGGRGGGPSTGPPPGGDGRGGGRGRGGRGHRDQHHHRKDRALKKQGGPWSGT